MGRSGNRPYKTSHSAHKAIVNYLIRVRDGRKKKFKADRPEFFSQPGVLASLFVDIFGYKTAKFNRDTVVKQYELCSFDDYAEWRAEMERLELIVVTFTKNAKSSYTDITPGDDLAALINKLVIGTSIVASTYYVDQRIEEVREDLNARLAEVEGMVDVLMTDYFDRFPPGDEVRKALLKSNLKQGKAYIEEDRIKLVN